MNQQTLEGLNQGDFFGVQLHVECIDPADILTGVRAKESGGIPVFCVADVGAALGVTDADALVRNVPSRHKLTRLIVGYGQRRKMWFVTEPGLYRILLRSRSPAAEKFTDWVTEDVLPSFRKTGLYAGDAAGLAEALMTSRNYAQVRGLAGSVHGLGITAMAVCRRSGLAWRARRKKGHEFPVAALDRAAAGRRAERGPLAARPDGAVFFYGQAAAAQNGGEA